MIHREGGFDDFFRTEAIFTLPVSIADGFSKIFLGPIFLVDFFCVLQVCICSIVAKKISWDIKKNHTNLVIHVSDHCDYSAIWGFQSRETVQKRPAPFFSPLYRGYQRQRECETFRTVSKVSKIFFLFLSCTMPMPTIVVTKNLNLCIIFWGRYCFFKVR